MSADFHLTDRAAASEQRARQCHEVAGALDARRAVLVDRPSGAVARHIDDVWRGRAATASRVDVHRTIVVVLPAIALQLAATAQALRAEAIRLEHEARSLRTEAALAAGAAVEAERPGARGPTPDRQ